MNRLSDYYSLKEDLKEKKNELWRLQQEYNSIVQQEPYMRGRLKNRQHTIYKLAGEIKSIEKELKNMEKAHLQDSMDMLKLMGWTTDSCGEKIYTKGESTEDQCKDGGSGSGIKGHTTSRSGYKMEDPKEIEAAIKKVKESGHPDPYYLSGLERALEVAKQERGMKDDDATEMGTFEQLGQNHETEAMEPSEHPVQAQDAEEQWITINGAHVKIEEGESKASAAKKFISKKREAKPSGGSSKKEEAPAKKQTETKSSTEKSDPNGLDKNKRRELTKQYKEGHYIKTENGEVAKISQIGTDYPEIVVERADGSLGSLTWYGLSKATRAGKEDIKSAKSKADEGKSDDQKSSEKYRKRLSNLTGILSDVMKSKSKKEEALKKLEENFSKMEEDIKSGKLGEESKKVLKTYKNILNTNKEDWLKKFTGDSDPKVAEANKLINLFGGAM